MPHEGYAGIFVSHGAPTLPLDDHPARDFLRELGARLPRPRALVVMSPHWEADGLFLKAPPRFDTWHDFGGFPDALYRLQYQPPGDAVLRDRAAALLREAGIPAQLAVSDRRLDHGAWVPLMLMFPDADIPLVQLSLPQAAPREVRAIGAALRPLAVDGVLLVGTGGAVHNLREIDLEAREPPPDWARAFDAWTRARVAAGDWAALDDWRRQGPEAARAHPSDDHFLPLFFAAGAGDRATVLHESWSYGSLAMTAYGFA